MVVTTSSSNPGCPLMSTGLRAEPLTSRTVRSGSIAGEMARYWLVGQWLAVQLGLHESAVMALAPVASSMPTVALPEVPLAIGP